jgi:hypothetical protein
LPSAPPAPLPPPKSNAQGIFVGAVSFSNDAAFIAEGNLGAKTTGALVPLDTRARTDALLEQLNSKYTLSPSSGTALYYAFHKAISNIGEHLSAKQGTRTIPDEIDSIFIITITDGLDNSSGNMLLGEVDSGGNRFAIPRGDRLNGKYPQYIESWLTDGNFDRVPVYSYTFGITGDGIAGADELRPLSRGKAPFIGNMEELKTELHNITSVMDIGKQRTRISVALPSFFNGDMVKIIIDSSHYIEADLEFDEREQAVYLTQIRSEPDNLVAESGRVRGVPGDGVFAYGFTLNMPPPANKTGAVELRAVNGTRRIDNEAFVNIYADSQAERKTSLVYFVLDSSRSLGPEIATVQREVSSIIEELFHANVTTAAAPAYGTTAYGTDSATGTGGFSGTASVTTASAPTIATSDTGSAAADSGGVSAPATTAVTAATTLAPPVAPRYVGIDELRAQLAPLPPGFFAAHGINGDEFWTRAGFSDTAAYSETDLARRAAYSLGYWVQLRSFREAGRQEAARSAESLRADLPSVRLAHIETGNDPYSYKLWVGPFADKTSADAAKMLLKDIK